MRVTRIRRVKICLSKFLNLSKIGFPDLLAAFSTRIVGYRMSHHVNKDWNGGNMGR